jgi:hypothetical protein
MFQEQAALSDNRHPVAQLMRLSRASRIPDASNVNKPQLGIINRLDLNWNHQQVAMTK